MDRKPQALKIILIGDSGVGKTCLILRYTNDIFNINGLPTLKVDFNIKDVHINSKLIRLQIWDTAGQERFRAINAAYYRGANGVLVVFDLTKQSSFNNIQSWVDDFKDHSNDLSPIVLIGNKLDLTSERVVSTEQAQQYADKIGVKYFETSAQNGENVESSFIYLATEIYNKVLSCETTIKPDGNSETIKITDPKNQNKRCC